MPRAKHLISAEGGAVAPLVGVLAFVLVASAGIAFDYSRIASLDTELQNAADQAALAGATQINQSSGARNRAQAAAEALVRNLTFFGNDGNADGTGVTINQVVFYATEQAAVADNGTACPATDLGSSADPDADANFICVRTTTRTANFALTPIVGALSGDASAMAVASIGSAICKVPPLMMCNPSPGQPLSASVTRGTGVRVTGHGNTKQCTGKEGQTLPDGTVCEQNVTAWSAGDFGFLEIGSGQNSELIKALAFQFLDFTCVAPTGQQVTTGTPQGVYDAINTRFGIYDFPAAGGGHVLNPCWSGSCPAAANTVKDLTNGTISDTNVNNNKCGLSAGNSGNGWTLPTVQYTPKPYNTTGYTYSNTVVTHDSAAGTIGLMGFPRDLCHYNSYGQSCGGTYPLKIGTGQWGRQDYWVANHTTGGVTEAPPNGFANMTRYDIYRWEIDNNKRSTASGQFANQNQFTNGQQCSVGTVSPGIDRRVLTVAVVENCAAAFTAGGTTYPKLTGASKDAYIGEFVDMFLVEPVIDGGVNNSRGNGDVKDSIYMEYIGPSPTGANGPQVVQRDVPYLVK